jgi:transposase
MVSTKLLKWTLMHSERMPRRRHGGELKAQVLAECEESGASVAAVAQSHGLNANLVHKWRRTQRAKAGGDATGTFVALQLPPQPKAVSVPQDIRIELRRGATTVNIAWPAQTASECAAWLREWLR